MKKMYIPAGLFLVTAIALTITSFTNYSAETTYYKASHFKYTSGAPDGMTGAPGEETCTECHSGTILSGNGTNSVLLKDSTGAITSENYVPNRTYHVDVSLTSASPKNGFEIVALTSGSAQAGTVSLIVGSGSKIVDGAAGKKYLTHTSSGTARSAWEFNWKAPATNVGDVTFYLATNETNNNGNLTGDKIRLSQHIYGTDAGVSERKNSELKAGYNPANATLKLSYTTLAAGSAHVNVTDLSGKSVFTEQLGTATIGENEEAVRLPAGLNAGFYIIHLNVDNRFYSRKVYIGN